MNLMHAGWDCNVYLYGNQVYKHYDKNCLGAQFEKRTSPGHKIKSIDSPIMEPIIDLDDNGFSSEILNIRLGSFSKINEEILRVIGADKLQRFVDELSDLNKSNIYHQDICPNHMRFSEDGRFVLIDWTHMNQHPVRTASFFNDDWVIWRLKRLIKNIGSTSQWFDGVGTLPLYWLSGNLTRWLLTEEKDSMRLSGIFRELLELQPLEFESLQGLYKHLLLTEHLNSVVGYLAGVVADGYWIQNYGEQSVCHMLKMGLCVFSFIESYDDVPKIYGNIPIFLNSKTIFPDRSDYGGS